MIPIASAYNTSGQAILQGEGETGDSEGGRPKLDDSELSDSGEQTREDETNENNVGM